MSRSILLAGLAMAIALWAFAAVIGGKMDIQQVPNWARTLDTLTPFILAGMVYGVKRWKT